MYCLTHVFIALTALHSHCAAPFVVVPCTRLCDTTDGFSKSAIICHLITAATFQCGDTAAACRCDVALCDHCVFTPISGHEGFFGTSCRLSDRHVECPCSDTYVHIALHLRRNAFSALAVLSAPLLLPWTHCFRGASCLGAFCAVFVLAVLLHCCPGLASSRASCTCGAFAPDFALFCLSCQPSAACLNLNVIELWPLQILAGHVHRTCF